MTTATGFKRGHSGDVRDMPPPKSRPDDANESGATAQHEKEQAMSLQQRNFIGVVGIPAESPFDTHDGPATGFGAIFAAFLNALHRSRRLRAERVIHQHRHLIAEIT
jgi:hypothetical protein